MDRRQANDLDNYITGHYGEDQFRGESEPDEDDAVDATYESDEELDLGESDEGDRDLDDDAVDEDEDDQYQDDYDPYDKE